MIEGLCCGEALKPRQITLKATQQGRSMRCSCGAKTEAREPFARRRAYFAVPAIRNSMGSEPRIT